MMSRKHIRMIIDRLKKSGHQVFVTGGAVRDMMLNRIPHDVDILTSATLEEVAALFSDQKVKIVGRTFPICLVNNIEISSGRGGANRAGFPESDLAMRDFTLNALAYDVFNKKIMDPFNGRKDMENRVIRFTKDPEKRIGEDPVRMIRACRFAGLISGTLSVSSYNAILDNRDLIRTVAGERIRHEIFRAMQLAKPSLFFKTLAQTQLLTAIFPSLDRCRTLDGGPYHGETVFEHCMLVGDALSPRQPMLRLAGFLHDVGKFNAARMKDGRLTFAGHEKETAALVDDLTQLRFSAKDIQYITSVTQAHMRPLTPESTDRAVRRLLAMLHNKDLDFRDFFRLRIADKKGNLAKQPYTLKDIRIRLERFLNVQKADCAMHENQLDISGNDIIRILGIEPGPKVGEVKKILLEYVMDHPELNTYTELEMKCRSLKKIT